MSQNCPPVLDYYYKIGEYLSNMRTREVDRMAWEDRS